jgi:hypothetical protein
MFFILRAFFWIGVVCLVLPAGEAPKASASKPEANASGSAILTSSMVSAARFCLDRADACRRGMAAAEQISARLAVGSALFSDIASRPAVAVASAEAIPLPPPRPAERPSIVR